MSCVGIGQNHAMTISTEPVRDRPGIDVIGDVHGNVERLRELLKSMGYTERADVFRHPIRTAVFVGDLIDRRRDHQLETLRVVRRMCDGGSAQVVLGNHEFNAVAYSTVDPTRWDYCRPHTSKNHKQHREFLEELGFDSPLHRSMIDWFRSIPLWLDLVELRIVHACWSERDIAHLEGVLDDGHTLNDEVVIDGTTQGTRTHRAIEHILKGPEVSMNGLRYFDKDGYPRTEARVEWWRRDATTMRAAAAISKDTQLHDEDGRTAALPDHPLPPDVPRYDDDVPVIFGHYWRSGHLSLDSEIATCVDYSAGKGGQLAAYRWCTGDTVLDAGRLVSA